MKPYFLIFIVLGFSHTLRGGCIELSATPQSPRSSNYKIDVTLDHNNKTAKCRQQLSWINVSPDTIYDMRFYMYLNAFKNLESTFLRESRGNVFGQDISRRAPETWGWIDIVRMVDQQGNELHHTARYIHPDDDNEQDQSVLNIPMLRPILPGDTIMLDMHFIAKMPKIIARAGYSKDDYFLFVHWFPQPGVYEENIEGEWGWNCHQFFPGTEFYSDFGSYNVTLTTSEHLVIGASGCKQEEYSNGDGTKTVRYVADDVIDFAWVAYPHFEEYNETWNHVDIRLLIPPEHCMLADRYLTAAKQGLEFMTEHVGRFPYPSLTIIDPPLHALRSGLMEYPMLITCGSFYRMPDNIRTLESLVIHEFVHQYFMATVANNEKEEAWLDEGFVTYYEDKIMDFYYGDNCSLYDVLGYRSGNTENSRLEYTKLQNPSSGIIARPGWEIKSGYKGLVYSKTAGMLKTIEGILGQGTMDKIMMTYYERWKFKHPRGKDFISVANEVAKDQNGMDLQWLFDQCLYDTGICDYRINNISNQKIKLGVGIFDDGGEKVYNKGSEAKNYTAIVICERLGEMIFPQDVHVTFEDGSTIIEKWDGIDVQKRFSYNSKTKVVSAHIDPYQKIYLDMDFNNNSLTLNPNKKPCIKYTTKAVHWLQNILQFSSIFM